MIKSIHRRSLPGVLPPSNPFAGGVGVLLVLCLWLMPTGRLMAQVPTYTGAEIISTFVPKAVNASGQMAGYIYVEGVAGASGAFHAARYSGGVVTDLGVLPGGSASEAAGINANGDVVGSATTASGLTHAFLYSSGVMTDLGTLPRGATSYATAINDAGQITGWSDTLQPNSSYPRPDHAFLYSGGVMSDIGNISSPINWGNFSVGNAINASGEVVGWSINDNFETHAFLYSGGHISDLGTLGGSESRARGINDSGTVVGWSYTSGDVATHAFKYKAGAGMTDLGTLTGNTGSTAAAINKGGQIIGSSAFSGTPAFIYTDATGMVKLDTKVSGASWSLFGASAISSAGHIIASGSNATVFATYFLLSPQTIAPPIITSGWNLLGNSVNAPLDVVATLGDTTKVTTVWKWIPLTSKWAFYAPSMTAPNLATYAASKGYDVLTTVNGGEGFWVNAKVTFTAQLPAGTAISTNNFADQQPPPNKLPMGWSLIAVGDTPSPRNFVNVIAITQPVAPAVAATSLTTLWAWDSDLSSWYFYAPSLDNSGGLVNYITTKSYLDFGARTLDPTMGFWVNHP